MTGLFDDFAGPGSDVRPSADWFLPEDLSALDREGIERGIVALADAGFGAVALFNVELALTADRNDLLKTALEAARRHEIRVDLTIGAALPPVGVPTIVPGGGAEQQELVYGSVAIPAGASFDGEVPEPADRDPIRPATLEAVVAARRAGSDGDAKPVLLEEDSLIDLSGTVEADKIAWAAPDGSGDWLLLGFWRRSTATPYADYLSPAGTRVVTDYWDQHVFTPEIQQLLDTVGRHLFEDALHLEGFHLWTPGFLDEFERRRGYSLTRYLPITVIANLNDFVVNTFAGTHALNPEAPAEFDSAGDRGQRIRNDYYETLSELYEENHLLPLNDWARSHGLRYRAKPAYHQSLRISAAALVDVPNTETFAMGNRIDGYRAMTGAVHLGRKPILAVEAAPTVTCVGHDLYSTTWKSLLAVVHGAFAAGANQLQLHGFAWDDAPGWPWPGYWPFVASLAPELLGPLGFSDPFGPRMPYWRHAADITGLLAREQLALRHGRPRVDVAIYRHSFWNHGFPILASHEPQDRWFRDEALQRAGYSYDFVGPELLGLPNATVADGRLDTDGPAYKALILDGPEQVNSVRGMRLASARTILSHVQAGLPVVVVGELPDRTGFYGDRQDDSEVGRTLEQLLGQPGVRRVRTEAEVVPALEALGVRPDFQPAEPSTIVAAHRSSGRTDLYFLFNQVGVDNVTGEPSPAPTSFDGEVSLAAAGRPHLLDAWTGEVRGLSGYTSEDGRVATRLQLAPGQATIIAVTPGGPDDRPSARPPYVGRLPAPIELTRWRLTVEDWRPGATPRETVHVSHELELESLAPWPEIPELEDVSGVGRYLAEVELDAVWTQPGTGVRLELGPLFDSVRVRVNGGAVPPVDPYRGCAEVTAQLHDGSNRIEVEIATTLRNRLRTLEDHAAFASAERQSYGLVGPVRLVPFAE
jgi:hypothetical protein